MILCVLNRKFVFHFQAYCAQQQKMRAYRLLATTAALVLTTLATTCAFAPKNQCGTQVKTVRTCMMPASMQLAAIAQANLELASTAASARVVSQGSIAPRVLMNVRVTPARVISPTVSMESMAILATVQLVLVVSTARIM